MAGSYTGTLRRARSWCCGIAASALFGSIDRALVAAAAALRAAVHAVARRALGAQPLEPAPGRVARHERARRRVRRRRANAASGRRAARDRLPARLAALRLRASRTTARRAASTARCSRYWMLLALAAVLPLALGRDWLIAAPGRRKLPRRRRRRWRSRPLGLAFYGAYYVVGVAVGRVKRTQLNWVVTGIAAVINVVLCIVAHPRVRRERRRRRVRDRLRADGGPDGAARQSGVPRRLRVAAPRCALRARHGPLRPRRPALPRAGRAASPGASRSRCCFIPLALIADRAARRCSAAVGDRRLLAGRPRWARESSCAASNTREARRRANAARRRQPARACARARTSARTSRTSKSPARRGAELLVARVARARAARRTSRARSAPCSRSSERTISCGSERAVPRAEARAPLPPGRERRPRRTPRRSRGRGRCARSSSQVAGRVAEIGLVLAQAVPR